MATPIWNIIWTRWFDIEVKLTMESNIAFASHQRDEPDNLSKVIGIPSNRIAELP
jgi:hypothetical protein